MFQKNCVVKARKAIEQMYDGLCTITERQKVRKEDKTTGFQDMVVYENVPCRLSFSRVQNAQQTETGSAIPQIIKLFMAPEIRIKPGSKITVIQNDVTGEYHSSGEPAMYKTHQEIVLEKIERWA